MARKRPEYWNDLQPLWWNEIKSWFSWGHWRQTITTIIIIFGSFLFLYLWGKIDIVKEEFWLKEAAILTGAFWFFIISIVGFVGANKILYTQQKKIQDEQIAKIIELKKQLQKDPFEFILKEPEYSNKNNERVCVFIQIFNTATVEIEDCHLKAKTQTMNNFLPLAWSEKNPDKDPDHYRHLKIIPGDVWRSDIVVAWEKDKNAIFCVFSPSDNDRIILPGTYQITISAIGKLYGHYTEHSQEYLLIYEGAKKLRLEKHSNQI
jgi:hypothetical protein